MTIPMKTRGLLAIEESLPRVAARLAKRRAEATLEYAKMTTKAKSSAIKPKTVPKIHISAIESAEIDLAVATTLAHTQAPDDDVPAAPVVAKPFGGLVGEALWRAEFAASADLQDGFSLGGLPSYLAFKKREAIAQRCGRA